jgi:hypothetical protein
LIFPINGESPTFWEMIHTLLTISNGNVQDVFNGCVLSNCDPGVKIFLLNPDVDVAFNNNSAIKIAVYRQYREIIDLLLLYPKCDPSVNDNMCIYQAVLNNDNIIVEKLLKCEKVNPSARDNICLKTACRRNNIPIVKLLLTDNRVNPTFNNNELLNNALNNHQLDLMTLLSEDHRVKAYVSTTVDKEENKSDDNESKDNNESEDNNKSKDDNESKDNESEDNDESKDNNKRCNKKLFCSDLRFLAIICLLLLGYFIILFPTNLYLPRTKLFLEACEEGNFHAVGSFLESEKRFMVPPYHLNSILNSNDSFCLRIAAYKGYYQIIKLLLSYPYIDPNMMDSHALEIAIYGNHTEIVDLLVKDPRVKIIYPYGCIRFPQIQNIIMKELLSRKQAEISEKIFHLIKHEMGIIEESQISITVARHH